MKAQELHVEVNAELIVSDETCKRCLKLVEMWLADNPNATISGGTRYADGTIEPLKFNK